MKCQSCGAEIPDQSKFCTACGAAIVVVCPSCQHGNPPGARFCGQCGTSLTTAAKGPVPTEPVRPAERRQLTVMFCDLVGSTELSARLDPEDLREVVGAYHRTCAEVIERAGGFVAKYLGDGVLTYFGYPDAHEDDPEQTIRAALALVVEVGKLSLREALRVRVGIATGLVVVGDLLGIGAAQEEAVVGETPNLAARLQARAEPDAIVISDSTRRQIGALFEVVDLGPQSVKGFGEQRAWRVVAENRALSRFEALRSGATPFIGRDEEIELLMRRWQQAKADGGRVVLVSGEAGVGKSRLVAALVERLETEPHTRLRYFCSSHHQESPLYPFIDQLERAARFERDDTPEAKLSKFEGLLADTSPADEDVALIAELLSLPVGERPSLRDLSPQRKKAKAFEALIGQVAQLSARIPVLMVFEDIHWLDPSSRDLLDQTIERVTAWPVLLVATFRPEFQPPWTGHPQVTTLALTRLGQRDTASLVGGIAGESALPAEIVEEIVERTDGVPLFVEELTKAVIETRASGGTGTLLAAVPRAGTAVPATLQASLMARLDHLGPAKEVAQVGAAIGRTFDYELLGTVLGWKEAELQTALRRLADAGLVFARGVAPQSTYLFKHALVQDAAYGSLLRSRRQGLHRKIAEILQPVGDIEPELLAHHFTEAELNERAINYWLKAGRQAMARSAMVEAVSHLEKGLDLLSSHPSDLESQQQELDLQVALGRALIATRGYSDPAVRTTYIRAHELCEKLGDRQQLLLVVFGEWLYHAIKGELVLALRMGEELTRAAQTQTDTSIEGLGQSCCFRVSLVMGEFARAQEHGKQALDLFDPMDRERLTALTGENTPSAVLSYWALLHAFLGHLNQARTHQIEAVSQARAQKHAHTAMHAVALYCVYDFYLRDQEAMSEHVEELIATSRKYGFPFWEAWGTLVRGYILVRSGDPEAGIEAMRKGLTALDEMGVGWFRVFALTLLAEAQGIAGQLDEGLRQLDEARDLMTVTQERWIEAEMHRIRGQLQKELKRHAAAQESLRGALAVAQRQGAKLWELRSALCLARLWRDQGKRAEARDLLAPVYDWFTEGFDTPDLQEARALLRELV